MTRTNHYVVAAYADRLTETATNLEGDLVIEALAAQSLIHTENLRLAAAAYRRLAKAATLAAKASRAVADAMTADDEQEPVFPSAPATT